MAALDAVPEQSRALVSKAALSMIRHDIKTSREKQRASQSESGSPAKVTRRAKAGRGTRATKRERSDAGEADAGAEAASKS